nr:hypothetical protein CFP56_12138 [Quercus suber]
MRRLDEVRSGPSRCPDGVCHSRKAVFEATGRRFYYTIVSKWELNQSTLIPVRLDYGRCINCHRSSATASIAKISHRQRADSTACNNRTA